MKKMITVFMTVTLLCFYKYGMSQTYDFSDGKIPDAWSGQKNYFEVSSTGLLHLLAPSGTSSAYVSWPIESHPANVWEFYVQYDFAASTTNYACFYALSQQQDPAAANNKSYYLKIGGIAGNTDKVELYYQNGTAKTKILESRSGLAGASKVTLRIRLTQSANGNWILYADNTGKDNFTKEASSIHQSNEVFNYSAIQCVYSSTRRDKFYFDDIQLFQPFMFSGYSFEDEQTLRIFFNKKLRAAGATSVVISSESLHISESSITNNELTIHYSSIIEPGAYTISVFNLYSIDKDVLIDSILQIEKKPFYYTGQLRITELMPDPTPSYGLPETEFIEIVNVGTSALNMLDFSIQNTTKSCKLPSIRIQPDSCLLLCPLHACPLYKISNCIELSCFPTLHNDGDSIKLYSKDGTFMDGFYYDITKLPNGYKRQGGYSIMKTTSPGDCMIDQAQAYSSISIGGTPGIIEKMPVSDKLEICTRALSSNSFLLSSNLYGSLTAADLTLPMDILAIHPSAGIQHQWLIELLTPMEEGTLSKGVFHSMKTCVLKQRIIEEEFDIIYPKSISKGDVYLNELLYNTYSGGVDFIEFVNVTDKYLQSKNMHLFHIDKKNKTQHIVLSDDHIIAPSGYRVLTSDTSILFHQYPNSERSNCFNIKPFLSLPDEGGRLFMTYLQDTLDDIVYGDFLQNPLNREKEGISLEKINPFQSEFNSSNWTSSASGASAGLPNSQLYISKDPTSIPFHCDPCHVVTQGQSKSSLALLYLNTSSSNSRGSLSIYTVAGEKVLDLFTNQILASKNTFQWNGQSSGNTRLPDGIYIAVAEWWLPDGEKFVMKIPVSTSAY